jgi:hypothetical protein
MSTRAPADIFRNGITGSMLRWLVERGTCSAAEFKAERIARGGTVNGTHSFDRYIADKKDTRGTSYIPEQGSYGIIVRTDNKLTLTWRGSEGETGFDRAVNWLRQLTNKQIDKALTVCSGRLIEALGTIDLCQNELGDVSALHKLGVSKQAAVALCGYATIDEAIWWFMAIYSLDHGMLKPWDVFGDNHLATLIMVLERMMLEATDEDSIARISAWFSAARAEDKARGAKRTIPTPDEQAVRDYLDQRPVIQY